MTRQFARGLVACVLAAGAGAPAFAADLSGQSVDVQWLFGSPAAVIASRAVTVGAGPEIMCAGNTVGPDLCSFFVDGATIDIGADTISLTIDSGTSYWGASDFNGYTFGNLAAGGNWTGYSLATTFAGVDDSLVSFTPDSLSINLQGIHPVAGQSFTFTLNSTPAVPEPANVAMLLAGLAALAGIARRKRA